MKIISVFILLVYWSFMISSPVIGKDSFKKKSNEIKIALNF